mmetsp:Transcript_5486/g.16354  ORF Transcript_5486/g.16354 Transcript_5486/m.16354 type:complete len:128 (-) Transcript_5486:161-544(-)
MLPQRSESMAFIVTGSGSRLTRRSSRCTVCSLPRSEKEQGLIRSKIAAWLDEEWIEQDIHRQLADRAAEVYAHLRRENDDADVGDFVLGVGQALEDFDMKEAFVGPFDVANKVGEIIFEEREESSSS